MNRLALSRSVNAARSHLLRAAKPSLALKAVVGRVNYEPSRFFSVDVETIKPWPKKMVESIGDYRDERFLEEHIGGPLYDGQMELPRLPVPTVEDTMPRLWNTASCLARTPEEFENFKKAFDAFPAQAKVLQERLLQKSEEMNDSSWLQKWWNQLGYLAVRDSVVINVSYWFQFAEDPTVELEKANVQRTAAILFATGEFRKRVASGSYPMETLGKKKIPICSTPFKYMFNGCRIPQLESDTYRLYDPALNNHALIGRKGHFFSVDIVHPETGNPLPLETIEAQVQQCVDLADTYPADFPTLGLLTSTDRDSWAKARTALIEAGGVDMEAALEKMESGAVLINMDDRYPVSRQECGEMMLSGGKYHGYNRWFDKTCQIMVANNGKSGILGEHSMMDGMVLVSYSDHVCNTSYEDAKERSKAMVDAPVKVENLFKDVTEKIGSAVVAPYLEEAQNQWDKLEGAEANSTENFQGYGSSYIKKAGFSPDAFVQMAMHLASYRLFGEQVGHYESTQTRPYLHGRTETTRTASVEAAEFLKVMGLRPKMDEANDEIRRLKLDLLKKATVAHSSYTALAGQGQAVDRHFFGLRMCVEDGEEVPPLFNDPVFIRSKTWRVSTSHLTHPKFLLWGFGQVVPDGIGLGYSIHPNNCTFSITALEETMWTIQMPELLEESLLELQRLVEHEKASQQ